MATNFPASLDTLTNPTSSDSLSSPSHSAQHANVNDAVEALQAKVGVDSSAVSSSLDYKVAQLEAAPDPGSVLVAQTSFSGAISVQVDNCFTSTYSVYKVYAYFDHGSDGLWAIRMTTGGTPEFSVYDSAYCNARAGGAVSGEGGSAQSYIYGGTGLSDLTTQITVFNPYQSLNTACHWSSHSRSGTYNYQTWGGARVNNTNSHDGIAITSGISQNISGNIWIYGVKAS